MNSPRPYLFTAIAVLVVAGCSGDSGTEVDSSISIDDFTGTWVASSHTFTSNAGAETFDLIANGGETRMTVLSGGRARTWVTIGTFSDEWDAQLSVSGDMLTSTPAESSRPVRHFAFTLVGDGLSLEDANSAFDFTLSAGAGVPATESIVLVRQ